MNSLEQLLGFGRVVNQQLLVSIELLPDSRRGRAGRVFAIENHEQRVLVNERVVRSSVALMIQLLRGVVGDIVVARCAEERHVERVDQTRLFHPIRHSTPPCLRCILR